MTAKRWEVTRRSRKPVATRFQLAKVAIGLSFTPGFECVSADAQQVGLSPPRICGRGLALPGWKTKPPSDSREDVACGDAAGVALVDRSAEGG